MVNLQCQLDLIWNHHRNTYPNVNSVFLERFIGERKIYVGCGLCCCTAGDEKGHWAPVFISLLPDCFSHSCPYSLSPCPVHPNKLFLPYKGKRTRPCISRSNWDHELLKGDFQELLVCPKAYDSFLPWEQNFLCTQKTWGRGLIPSLWSNSYPYQD